MYEFFIYNFGLIFIVLAIDPVSYNILNTTFMKTLNMTHNQNQNQLYWSGMYTYEEFDSGLSLQTNTFT